MWTDQNVAHYSELGCELTDIITTQLLLNYSLISTEPTFHLQSMKATLCDSRPSECLAHVTIVKTNSPDNAASPQQSNSNFLFCHFATVISFRKQIRYSTTELAFSTVLNQSPTVVLFYEIIKSKEN